MSFSAIYPVLCVDDPIQAAESFTKAFGLRPVFKENWYVHLKSESHQIGFVSDKHESIPIEIGYKSQGNFITIDSNDVNESWKKLKDDNSLEKIESMTWALIYAKSSKSEKRGLNWEPIQGQTIRDGKLVA